MYPIQSIKTKEQPKSISFTLKSVKSARTLLENELQLFKPTSEELRVKEFQIYLSKLLYAFIDNKDVIYKMLGPEQMRIWIQAFTHQSANHQSNYEVLETLGDISLSYAFKKYLFLTYKDITQGAISEYNHYYTSKEYLGNIGLGLGFKNWIIAKINVNESILEDVTESFIGVIDLLGDRIQDGLGILLVSKFVTLLFKEVTLDKSIELGPPKTRLEQYGSRLKIGKDAFYLELHNEENKYIAEIKYTNEMKNIFDKYHFKVKPVIGYAVNHSKKKAETEAYKDAINNLNKAGFTEEFILALLQNKDELYNKVLARAVELYNSGIIKIVFDIIPDDNKLELHMIGLTYKNSRIDLNYLPIKSAKDNTVANQRKLMELFIK
jgi:dsRNA-specific ribonuclease